MGRRGSSELLVISRNLLERNQKLSEAAGRFIGQQRDDHQNRFGPHDIVSGNQIRIPLVPTLYPVPMEAKIMVVADVHWILPSQ